MNVAQLLAGIPPSHRDVVIAEFASIRAAFAESRWKLAGLDAGRFCEVVYCILDGALSGNFAPQPSKPSNFPQACKNLENHPAALVGDHSLRILIPRTLPAIYDVRNNRNVGHVGGDVEPNAMDAGLVHAMCTWIMCELVRVFHAVSVPDAQKAVDALTERKHPLVWEHDGIRRVLAPEMSAADRTLLLLYSVAGPCSVNDLQTWTKYKKNYRKQILEPLATDLVLELLKNDSVVITSRGLKKAEELLARHVQ